MLRSAFNYLILERNARLSEDRMRILQWQKFQRLIDHAYNHVPYYRELFDGAGICPKDIANREDVCKIPVTTKTDLRNAGEKVFSSAYARNRLHRFQTSGSTGEPFLSYFDNRSHNILKFASKIRARRRCGLRFRDRAVNIEVYTPAEVEKMNRLARRSDVILPMRYLSIHDSLESHLQFFLSYRPKILYGLPSYFLELASYLEDKQINWYDPKIIFTSGELVPASVREKIGRILHASVYDVYGITEVKEIAWECPEKNGYHINEDLHLVEFLPEAGRDPLLAVTSLEQYAMPFIRYIVGDRGNFKPAGCACGLSFGLMSATEGREVDYIALADGRRVSPYILTMAMEKIAGLDQYQLVQTDARNLVINVKTKRTDQTEVSRQISGALEKVIGKNMVIATNFCQTIPREASGKYRVVKVNENN